MDRWTGQISWVTTATDLLTKRLPCSTNTVRRSPPSAVRLFCSHAVIAIFTALAIWGGEVDPTKFVDGLPRFWSYFYDITPKLRLTHFSTDFVEWFWNWDGWLLLLAETLLVAYVGTFLGALLALFSASLPAQTF